MKRHFKVYASGDGNGYSGYSMSNNAVAAYNDGEKPLSKWAKTDILNAVKEIDGNKVPLISKVSLPILKKHLLYNSSWHHTSSMYNKTEFYAIDEDVVESLDKDTVDIWIAESKQVEMPQANIYRGDFEYIEWVGTRKHPKAIEHKLEDVNIEERGSFYYVTDDAGNQLIKKKIGSNGTYVRKI